MLFVGTKRSAREAIAKEAARCGMPYVSHRWLGGMLTNFKTIRQSIQPAGRDRRMLASGIIEGRSKREAQTLRREREKLDRSLGGIKEMDGLPDALFVIDVGHEAHRRCTRRKSSASRSSRSWTPTARPDGISYVIPGNDDAMRAIQLYAAGIADAVLEGRATIPRGRRSARTSSSSSTRKASRGRRSRAAVARRRCGRSTGTPSAGRCGGARESDAAAEAAAVELIEADPEESPEAFMARRAAARKKSPAPAAPVATARLPMPPLAAMSPTAAMRPVRWQRYRRGRGIMTVTAEAVKLLRERTGAGMMECKKALVEARRRPGSRSRDHAQVGPRQG